MHMDVSQPCLYWLNCSSCFHCSQTWGNILLYMLAASMKQYHHNITAQYHFFKLWKICDFIIRGTIMKIQWAKTWYSPWMMMQGVCFFVLPMVTTFQVTINMNEEYTSNNIIITYGSMRKSFSNIPIVIFATFWISDTNSCRSHWEERTKRRKRKQMELVSLHITWKMSIPKWLRLLSCEIKLRLLSVCKWVFRSEVASFGHQMQNLLSDIAKYLISLLMGS